MKKSNPKVYDEMYVAGDRVRVVNDKAGDLAKSLLRRKGVVVYADFNHSDIDGIMCYLVQMDNRVNPCMFYHDELETVNDKGVEKSTDR